MDLVAIGIGVLGISMCLMAAEVVPAIRSYWRRRNKRAFRNEPRVRTIITIKEETKNGERRSTEADDGNKPGPGL